MSFKQMMLSEGRPVDFDIAAYFLGCSLGIFPEIPRGDKSFDGFRAVKWVFWTTNLTGEMLHEMLQDLAKVGVLTFNDDDNTYLYNEAYVPV